MQNITSDDVPDAPRITFPTEYPVKVIYREGDGVDTAIDALVRETLAGVEVTLRRDLSRQGRFAAVTATFVAENLDQIKRLNTALKAHPAVVMTL